MTVKTNKPPTQIAGVNGFNAHGVMGGGAPQDKIDWPSVVSLPPFQMFACEQSGQTNGDAVTAWVQTRIALMGDAELYEQYAQWHKHKGYWPNETPMGSIKD